MAKIKEKAASKTNLIKIVDPLQKLLDQRAALDAQITAMKKELIAAIENEETPAKPKTAPKTAARRKPGAKKAEPKPAEAKAARGRKAGAKKAGTKKAEAVEL